MASETEYLRAILPSLPTGIAAKLRSLCATPATESALENLVRFICGAQHSPEAPKDFHGEWFEKQLTTRNLLKGMNWTSNSSENKRPREDGTENESESSKRPRISPAPLAADGNPIYTLHSISTTSPIRKKVDITICENSITFTNPSTRALEASVPRASIRRAFLVPTRGKSKPHWTVILLSSDTPDRGRPANPATPENPQIIFGLDATSAPPFTVTTYKSGSEPTPEVSPKGSTTLPFICTFLIHLGVALFEPTADVFKSACAGIGNNVMAGSIPGVEAYRAAKSGSLWFMKEGILWGESKPCEFWPVRSLINKREGVRIIGGSGRTCSVVLTRKTEGKGTDGDDEEDMGEETEFGMVDAREQEGIDQWVKKHRHLFGKTEGDSTDEGVDVEPMQPKKIKQFGPVTINQLATADDEDDEDHDFAVDSDSESDGGSASSSSDGDGAGGSGGSDEEEGGEASEGSDEDGEEEEELKPEHHPLLRPGAMPKMSRAAMDMVVGMVEDDMMGGEDDDEEDELDD
jgi:hypothetical protein